jgi:Glycosyl transferases group 1
MKRILLLSLVHPDFLPPVYAVAQVLRDCGYKIHILTFESLKPGELDLGADIDVDVVGKMHGVGLKQRLQLRKKYISSATASAASNCKCIISFCSFSYLCGLKIKGALPLIFIKLESHDFRSKDLLRSPLSAFENLRTLQQCHKADIVATPSYVRSGWLAGRCRLKNVPETILNTVYYTEKKDSEQYAAIFSSLVPDSFRNKTIVLYTGAVNHDYCIKELLFAFDGIADETTALIITGLRDNEYCKQLRAYADSSQNKNRILLLSYVTRAELIALQQNSHIGVCLARETPELLESKMTAPNKVGEYFGNGLYVLGSENNYMAPIKMLGVASLAKTADLADIKDALSDAIAQSKASDMKQRIDTFVKNFYSMQQQMRVVIEYIQKL